MSTDTHTLVFGIPDPSAFGVWARENIPDAVLSIIVREISPNLYRCTVVIQGGLNATVAKLVW